MLKLDTTDLSLRVRQHGVLHGGVETNCRNDDYPGIYTRVDNYDVWTFIKSEGRSFYLFNFNIHDLSSLLMPMPAHQDLRKGLVMVSM